MSIDRQDIPDGGGSKRAFAARQGPVATPLYIDHLLARDLRRRANDDRADAAMLADRLSPEAVAMLIADAERCESRAAQLDAAFSVITEYLQVATSAA